MREAGPEGASELAQAKPGRATEEERRRGGGRATEEEEEEERR
jgi:hypothetical protein